MSQESVEYERFVRDVMEALLRAQGLATVKVQHDVQVPGTFRSHQVDVYWEYRLAGVLHRVVINCKRYRSTVEVTDVHTLMGVLADMPGVRGVVVTTVGFQKGAMEVAQGHGIGLKVIREPLDEDYGDRLRSLRGVVKVRQHELVGLDVEVDGQWISANLSPESGARWTGRVSFSGPLTTIADLQSGETFDLNQAWRAAVAAYGPSEIDDVVSHRMEFDNAFISMPEFERVKLCGISFRWALRAGPDVPFGVDFDVAAIVRDAISGTLLFVDPNGVVSGDVAEEFGPPRP